MSRLFISLAVFLFATLAYADGPNLRQTTMQETLRQVIAIFSEEYAPFEFKTKSEKIDLLAAFKSATDNIDAHPEMANSEFQDLLVELLSATRDFHVSINFYSTEYASLPFSVMLAEGRYFVSHVNRNKISAAAMPGFDVGTEILEFGGLPVSQAVRALIPQRYTEPSLAELRLAETQLTERVREFGMHVPSGGIKVKVQNPGQPAFEIPFVWEYTPEYVPDIPLRNFAVSVRPSITTDHFAVKTEQRPSDADAFALGSLASFVPLLGTSLGVVSNSSFGSYIFRLSKGSVIGYVRIPTFETDRAQALADEFGELVQGLNEKTDALVVDLTHNPGGSILYMYALLSHLSDRPLKALPQQIMVSSDMAADSGRRVAYGPLYQNEEEAKKELAPLLNGMFPTFEMFQSFLDSDRFILSELKAGRRLTKPTSFFGLSEIVPHPTQHYSKPILVLTDALDFSAADLFPAILQDNHRATVFGERTAGAGGAVKKTEFPNQFNIRSLNYTWTLAQRLNGEFLENAGVRPDVPYAIRPVDLQKHFEGYRQAVVNAIEGLLPRKP